MFLSYFRYNYAKPSSNEVPTQTEFITLVLIQKRVNYHSKAVSC